jgi:hypothetical protein
MKTLAIAVGLVALCASVASADHGACARRGHRHLKTEPVTMATQIGDVAIWPGGAIDWVEIVDSDCARLDTQIKFIRLTGGGAICGAPVERGVTVAGPTQLGAPVGSQRGLQLFANDKSTLTVNGLTVRTDQVNLVCSSAGLTITSGVLAKPGTVAGVALGPGDYFSGNPCFTELDLSNAARINGDTFPGSTRIHFENCRPESVQTLDGAPDVVKFTHAGVTCILDMRSRAFALHPATGHLKYCQNVVPFSYAVAGAKRTVKGGFSGVHFYADGKIERADLADDTFFGVFFASPQVELAPDGRLLRLHGVLRERHVFGQVTCRASSTILDGTGAVEHCDREQ